MRRGGHKEVSLRRRVTTAAGACVCALSLWVLTRALERTGFPAVASALETLRWPAIAAAAVFTALNYAVLTWHDQLAFRYASIRIARGRIALASFVGYAVSNNLGFALLSGTSARYRFYERWGLNAADLSRIVLFYSTTFWLGLCVVGGSSLLFAPPAGLVDVVSPVIARSIGLAALLFVSAYLVICLLRRAPLQMGRVAIVVPEGRLVVSQFGISILDWLLAAAPIFVLLPSPRPSFLVVAGAFAAAQLVALVSHVPGGLGVFEGLMVLFLAPAVSAAALVPALVVFRLVYYLLPLAVALTILLVDEARLRHHALARWGVTVRSLGVWATPRILAIFIFASGALLLYSGATPGVPSRLAWLANMMPLPLVEASHFTASLTGLLLLLLAQAIARRSDAAFYVTAAALAIGIGTSLLKGGDYEEAVVLALVLAALVAARHHFTRRARVFARPLSPGWLAAVGTVVSSSVWLGSFAYRHVTYTGDLWWMFTAEGDAPRFLRASVGVTIVALAIGIRQLLRPALPRPRTLDADALPDVTRVVVSQPNTLPMLVYVGDKQVLWNDDRTAFVMYAVRGHSCVALGDPVGPSSAARELIGRFLERCHEAGALPVFYEASSQRLSDFADFGLVAVKIGEEARVPLTGFSLSGSEYKTLRAPMNRLDREGFAFRVVDPLEVAPLLPQLAEVSDEWLALKAASEKGFSVGYFNEEYLKRSPVAIVARSDRIEAFANLWTGDGRYEMSADLMRHRADAPAGVMDGLFAHLMLWGRAQGYEWFNLGMAPLAGLPQVPAGHTWTRIGQFIYAHGEAFYNFQGLRAYKNKFNPVWEPRYLVYTGGLALPRVVADVASLIAGGYVRLFFRPGRRAA